MTCPCLPFMLLQIGASQLLRQCDQKAGGSCMPVLRLRGGGSQCDSSAYGLLPSHEVGTVEYDGDALCDYLPPLDTSRKLDELAFVDRRQETHLLAEELLINQKHILMGSAVKQTLVTAGQMYGSGKTTLGRNAINALRLYPNGPLEVYNQIRHTDKFGGVGLLDAYRASVYVPITMKYYLPTAHGSFSAHLAFVLCRSFLGVLEPSSTPTPQEVLQMKMTNVQEVVEHMQRKCPTKTFFLHWDEVGTIESSMYTKPDGFRPAVDLLSRMERYYSLWMELDALQWVEGVYNFVSDKRPAFALIGLGLVSTMDSPSLHRHLVVGGLRPKDIVETFQRSVLGNGALLTKYVVVNDDLLGRFGELVFGCTEGIPRLIEKTLEALCTLQDEPLQLQTEQQITAALDRCYVLVRKHMRVVSLTGDSELLELYLAFMATALLRQPIDKESTVYLRNSLTCFNVLHFIDQLNIFIDYPAASCAEPTTKILLRFPKWLLRHILDSTRFADFRFPLLAPLLPMAGVLDRGAPFEMLLRTVISFSLSFDASDDDTWASRFPIFHGTCVARNSLHLNRERPICFVPGVGSSNATSLERSTFEELLASPLDIWLRRMHSKDWPLACEVLVVPSCIVHPAPQSKSPDLIFISRVCEYANVLFAAKHNSGENCITWSIIQDEINKAAPLISVKPVCLVIMALHLGKAVKEAMASRGVSTILLTAGSWGIQRGDVALQKKGGKGNVALRVPEGMELLIVGSEGLKSFVGETNVQALELLADVRRQGDPNLYLGALRPPVRHERPLAAGRVSTGAGVEPPPKRLRTLVTRELAAAAQVPEQGRARGSGVISRGSAGGRRPRRGRPTEAAAAGGKPAVKRGGGGSRGAGS